MAGSPGLPDDLRKQIEDALAAGQVDRLPNAPPPRSNPSPGRAPRSNPSPGRAPRLPDLRPRSPSQLLLVGALVALVGWVFRFPYSQEVLYVGLVCVGIALLSMLLRPQGHSQHYWRGRPVDLPPESWTDRLYRLLYRG